MLPSSANLPSSLSLHKTSSNKESLSRLGLFSHQMRNRNVKHSLNFLILQGWRASRGRDHLSVPDTRAGHLLTLSHHRPSLVYLLQSDPCRIDWDVLGLNHKSLVLKLNNSCKQDVVTRINLCKCYYCVFSMNMDGLVL